MNILKPFNWFKSLFKEKEKPRKASLRDGELEITRMGGQMVYITVGGIEGSYAVPEEERHCRIAWCEATKRHYILVDIQRNRVRDLTDRQLKNIDLSFFPMTVVK